MIKFKVECENIHESAVVSRVMHEVMKARGYTVVDCEEDPRQHPALCCTYTLSKGIRYTPEQQQLAKMLIYAGYNYIAKDKNGSVFAYTNLPEKSEAGREWTTSNASAKLWVEFPQISWEDDNPTALSDIEKSVEN